MRYLGAMTGRGQVTRNGVHVAKASYDLDGYTQKAGEVTGSGEIRMAREALTSVFGRSDLTLITGDGLVLNVRFVDKELNAGNIANVSVTGDLPADHDWRRSSTSPA